jgi:hypothetical protein
MEDQRLRKERLNAWFIGFLGGMLLIGSAWFRDSPRNPLDTIAGWSALGMGIALTLGGILASVRGFDIFNNWLGGVRQWTGHVYNIARGLSTIPWVPPLN